MTEERENRVGATVGAFRIDRVLGVGGMATVYAATHAGGRRVALKVLRRDLAGDLEIKARFLAEAEHVSRIVHPDRLEILGTESTEDHIPLLVMELLEGETLAALWQRKRRIPLTHALAIAERLLDFLHACHGARVVHRDLKPANLFLTFDGRLKVIDFGVARSMHRSITTRRLALGTPCYMSPEQAAGDARVDARTDLYAVGAILWSILAGQNLRRGRDDDDTLAMAMSQPVRSLAEVAPDLPKAVVALIDRALADDPRRRPQSAREMRASVIDAVKSLGVEPHVAGPVPASDRPTQPSTPSSIRHLEPPSER